MKVILKPFLIILGSSSMWQIKAYSNIKYSDPKMSEDSFIAIISTPLDPRRNIIAHYYRTVTSFHSFQTHPPSKQVSSLFECMVQGLAGAAGTLWLVFLTLLGDIHHHATAVRFPPTVPIQLHLQGWVGGKTNPFSGCWHHLALEPKWPSNLKSRNMPPHPTT